MEYRKRTWLAKSMNISVLLFGLLFLMGCKLNSNKSVSNGSFEEWVHSELQSGKNKIIFPKGVHHAYADNVYSEFLHLSNHDDGIKNILFNLKDKEDLLIDGNGAELILHGHIIPFYLKNAKNITIKNLTIDWEHPFFAQGEITEVGDGYFDVRFADEYPATIMNNNLVFINPDLDAPMGFININFINQELGRLVYRSWDEYEVAADHIAEKIDEGLFRIHSDHIMSPLKPGHIAVFQYLGRSSPAIVAHQSNNVHLTNLTQYHAAGMATLFEGSSNIYIDSMQIIRRPGSGRWFTTHHDATHFVECRGDIHIKGCNFEFHGDDDCNIHGIFRPVAFAGGKDMLVVDHIHFQQIGVKGLFTDDIVGFYNRNTLELLGEGKLKKVMRYYDSPQRHRLYFDKELPDLNWQNVVVALRDYDVNVQINGNHFSNHRARGILVKTLGKVRIYDNYFHTQGGAINLGCGAGYWYESGPLQDVEIYNNVFDQCNTGGFSPTTFNLRPGVRDINSRIAIYKNIRIHNNKIIQIFKPMMLASHIENLEFYDNEIIPGTEYEHWYKGNKEPEMIVISKGVTKGRFQDIQ